MLFSWLQRTCLRILRFVGEITFHLSTRRVVRADPMHTLIRHVFHDAVFTPKKGLVGNVVRSLNVQNEARSVRQRQYWPLVFSNFNIKKKERRNTWLFVEELFRCVFFSKK